MTPEDEAQNRQETRAAGPANLARQYRKIGISAVAAALPYKGEAKNPVHAPADPKYDPRFDVAA